MLTDYEFDIDRKVSEIPQQAEGRQINRPNSEIDASRYLERYSE